MQNALRPSRLSLPEPLARLVSAIRRRAPIPDPLPVSRAEIERWASILRDSLRPHGEAERRQIAACMMDLRLVRAMTPMNEAEAERLVDIWCDVLEGTPIDLICHEFTIEISHGKEAFFPAPSRIRDGAHELTRRRRDDIAALDRLAQIAGGELPAPRVASINEWRNLPRADKPVSLMQRWREFQRNAAAGDGEGSA